MEVEMNEQSDVAQRMWQQAQAVDRRVQAAVAHADARTPDAARTIVVVLEGALTCGALPEAFVARLLRKGGAA